MKEEKPKKYRANQYPMYALSFGRTRDWQKVLKFQETSNIQDGTEPLLERIGDMSLFGMYLADSKLLTKGDKEALAEMFKTYLRHYKGNITSA